MSNTPVFSVGFDLVETDGPGCYEWRIVVGGTRRGGVTTRHGYWTEPVPTPDLTAVIVDLGQELLDLVNATVERPEWEVMMLDTGAG